MHIVTVADPVALAARVRALMEMKYSIHHHVWTQRELRGMLLRALDELPLHFDIDLCLKDEGEIIVVLRKTA